MCVLTINISDLKVIKGLLNIWTAARAASRDLCINSCLIDPIRLARLTLASSTNSYTYYTSTLALQRPAFVNIRKSIDSHHPGIASLTYGIGFR